MLEENFINRSVERSIEVAEELRAPKKKSKESIFNDESSRFIDHSKPLLNVGEFIVSKRINNPPKVEVLGFSKTNYFLHCEKSGDFLLDFRSVHSQFLKLTWYTHEIA